jgi:hypothetical protein
MPEGAVAAVARVSYTQYERNRAVIPSLAEVRRAYGKYSLKFTSGADAARAATTLQSLGYTHDDVRQELTAPRWSGSGRHQPISVLTPFVCSHEKGADCPACMALANLPVVSVDEAQPPGMKWLPHWLREDDPLAVRGAQPYRVFSEGEGDRPAPVVGAKRLMWVDFIRGQPSAGDHNLAQLIRAAEGTPGHLKRRIEWLDDALHVQRPMGPLKRGRGPSVKRARHRVRIRTFSGDEEDRLLLERWGPRPPMKAGRQTSASSWGHGRAASDAPRPANASAGGGLTGEQKARIARNKAAALERKRARLQGL